MSDLAICAILLTISSIVGVLATMGAIWLSHRTGILDKPGGRKVHQKPVAYLGGLGFTVTMLAGVALFAWLSPLQALVQERIVLAYILGLVAIFLVGLWDDVANMRPLIKLGFQLLIAFGLWLAGVRVERITVGVGQAHDLMLTNAGTFIDMIRAGWPSLVITLCWFAGLMNAINLIDGLDGLAGGVSFIASISLGAVAIITWPAGITLGMALPIIAAGGCLGFLVHNWHPAKIFLGDSGSLSIGYTLATASLLTSTKTPALMALIVPMIALGLPLFETAFSFLRRAMTGGNPFKADRRHLHHRLLDAGLDQRRVVLIFWYATMYFGATAVLLARGASALLLINVVLIAVGLLMLIEYLKYFEKKRAQDVAARESEATPPHQPILAEKPTEPVAPR